MANSNVPAHDFAPSWLKIPAYDSTSKNAHTDGAYAPRREEHRPQRRTSGGRTHFGPSDGHRDWDGHPLGGRSPFFISRHHSLDVEEGHHPGVPPPLHPPPHVDFLVPPRRPHSRHDFRGFQPSYQKVNSGSQSGDNCSFPVLKSGTGVKPTTEGNRKDLASNNFNQEFPTLQGNSEAPIQPSITNGSVWENPRNSKVHGTVLKKVHLFQRPLRNDSYVESRSKSPSGGVTNSPLSSSGPVSPKLTRHATCQSLTGGSVFKTLTPAKNQQPHTMEILVKHPKTKGNKGDFLKALKSGDESKEEDAIKGDGDAGENCTVNGERQRNESLSEDARSEDFDDSMDFSKLSLDNSSMNTPLSSSLEAEQRLLREMGWKEEALDDDAYAPLTEDELREYQNLTKLRQEKQRNGTAQRPQLWSPRRVAPPLASTATALLNESGRWSSSSSDSSDSDSN
ncbi:vasculin-like isoform X2 [Ornithodoros turicata]|uniref:vasculin-like isoform X2 n=1 Tax=Ornithodoros turicata TaxID=34597 RepID=UPI0031390382